MKLRPAKLAYLKKTIAGAVVLFLCGVSYPEAADANWTWRNPLPQGNHLNRVVWADDRFIAVGDYGTVVTSRDGEEWAVHPPPVPQTLHGLMWTGTEAIAVGAEGVLLRSADGVSWDVGSAVPEKVDPESIVLRGISRTEDGVYLAVGNLGGSALIVLSTDGEAWTIVEEFATYASARFHDVVWSGERFVAVGQVYNNLHEYPIIRTSPDGAEWGAGQYGGVGGMTSVTWTGEEFVAAGWARFNWRYAPPPECVLISSADGIEWTKRYQTTTPLYGADWIDGKQIATGSNFAGVVTMEGRIPTAPRPSPLPIGCRWKATVLTGALCGCEWRKKSDNRTRRSNKPMKNFRDCLRRRKTWRIVIGFGRTAPYGSNPEERVPLFTKRATRFLKQSPRLLFIFIAITGFPRLVASADEEWRDEYTVEGPVSVIAEGITHRGRMGPFYHAGIASPDGKVAIMLGNSVSQTSEWGVVAFDRQAGEELWTYRTAFSTAGVQEGVFSPGSATVYLVGDEDGQTKVIALNSTDGEIIWKRNTTAGAAWAVAVSSDGQRVFAVGSEWQTGEGLVTAYDAASGEELWIRRTGNEEDRATASHIGLSEDDAVLFIAGWLHGEPALLARDAGTGERVWSAALPHSAEAVRVAAGSGNIVVAGVGEGEVAEEELILAAYQPSTGELVWEVREAPEGLSHSRLNGMDLSRDGRRVFVNATQARLGEDSVPFTHAYHAYNGYRIWRSEELADVVFRGRDGLAIDRSNGDVIVGQSEEDGPVIRILARDPLSGVEKWRVERAAWAHDRLFGVVAVEGGVSIFGGLVEHPDEQSGGYVTIALQTGEPPEYTMEGPVSQLDETEIWKSRSGSPTFRGAAVSPDGSLMLAIGGYLDMRYVTTHWNLEMYDRSRGERMWAYLTSADEQGPDWLVGDGLFSSAGDRVFVAGSAEGKVKAIAFRPGDGTILWDSVSLPGVARAVSLSPNEERLFVTGYERRFFGQFEGLIYAAFDTATGEKVWMVSLDEGEDRAGGHLIRATSDGERIVVAGVLDGREIVFAADAKTGEEIWRREMEGTAEGLEVSDEFITIAGRSARSPSERELLLTILDVQTGEIVWSDQWEGTRSAEYPSVGVSADGKTVFLAGQHAVQLPDESWGSASVVQAYVLRSGERLWTVREAHRSYYSVVGSLTVMPETGHVFFGELDREADLIIVRGYHPETGVRQWSVRRDHPGYVGGRIIATKATGSGFSMVAGSMPFPEHVYGGYLVMSLETDFSNFGDSETFLNWQRRYFNPTERQIIEVKSALGDLGGFGISNLLRYALALDPYRPQREKLPRPRTVTVGINGDIERYLGLTFTRRPDAVDLEYIPESSGDMEEWIRLPEANIMRREESADGTETVTIADWVPMEDAETRTRFMRLRVERQP